MLAQGQIDRYPAALVELFAQVEQDITADIARRIAKTDLLTPTAKWQAKKVKQMRQAEQYVMQQIAALSHKSWAELRRVFDEAATETLEFDDHIYEAAGLTPSALSGSPALKAVIEEGLKKTGGLYKNLTGTIANTVAKQFEDALDHAYLQVISGAFSPQAAIRSAVKALAAAGMQTIRYPSGHRDHIDVAIRRATITGLSQTSAQLQLARAEEMGCDLVQVSSHMGARPSHAEWQGKIYSRSGKHPKYPGFVSSTGYGTGEGLCGWNCKHSFYPFFEGLSVDTYKRYDEKENDRVYVQSQRQREYERRIRQSKRECAAYDAAGQPEDFSRSAAKLKRQERELKDFMKTTDLTRKRDREQVLGFGHSQSSKAVWSAKKPLNTLGNGGTINTLPRAESAKISIEKFTQYALNPDKDPNKAKAFQQALGYNMSNADKLLENIKSHIKDFEAKEKPDNGYGKRFEVTMSIIGENGKKANVKTAWIVDKDTGETRLTSAYVDKAKKG